MQMLGKDKPYNYDCKDCILCFINYLYKTLSNVNRLSENTKSKKLDIDFKGLVTRKFAKMPILGQPVKMRPQ